MKIKAILFGLAIVLGVLLINGGSVILLSNHSLLTIMFAGYITFEMVGMFLNYLEIKGCLWIGSTLGRILFSLSGSFVSLVLHILVT